MGEEAPAGVDQLAKACGSSRRSPPRAVDLQNRSALHQVGGELNSLRKAAFLVWTVEFIIVKSRYEQTVSEFTI
jgi:hypothetical protein